MLCQSGLTVLLVPPRSVVPQRPDVEPHGRPGEHAVHGAPGDEHGSGCRPEPGTGREPVSAARSLCSFSEEVCEGPGFECSPASTCRLFPEVLAAWDGCQKYFFRSWARRTALQTALQVAAKVGALFYGGTGGHQPLVCLLNSLLCVCRSWVWATSSAAEGSPPTSSSCCCDSAAAWPRSPSSGSASGQCNQPPSPPPP